MRTAQSDLSQLSALMLDWFDSNARQLAWRTPIGVRRDPYHVWLAEIMLQQTTTVHAAPYFQAFIRRWPTVQALAGAPEEEILSAWAGLGYYARARNLIKCARLVADRGGFPQTAETLRALPGIGPYTAGAIAALAFGEPVAAVDGNVERIFARLMALEGPWAEEKKRISRQVAALVPQERPGDFAEALMDLGATVCTPAAPSCGRCPLSGLCLARQLGAPARFPVKPPKTPRPIRFGHAFVLVRNGDVWLIRNPEAGLLAAMPALPTSAWQEQAPPAPEPPVAADWREVGEVRHVFTHFGLRLTVWSAQAEREPQSEGWWADPSGETGLPSVFVKALCLVCPQAVRVKRR